MTKNKKNKKKTKKIYINQNRNFYNYMLNYINFNIR